MGSRRWNREFHLSQQYQSKEDLNPCSLPTPTILITFNSDISCPETIGEASNEEKIKIALQQGKKTLDSFINYTIENMMDRPQSAPERKTQATQTDFPDSYTSLLLAIFFPSVPILNLKECKLVFA